jgi:hypothetical protein
LIGDVGGFPIGRWIVSMSNDGGEPFNDGGNMPPRGDGCCNSNLELAKVWAKSEAQESHFMFPGM